METLVILAIVFPEKIFPRFLACMGIVFILAICFQKKIVRVFRMYGHDFRISHVFPEKDCQVF